MHAWQFAKAQCAAPTRFVSMQNHYNLIYPELDVEVIDRVAKVAAETGVPSAQMALAWLMHTPGVTAPIIGATKLGHVEDALLAESLSLSEEQIARLEEPYVPHPVSGIEL